MFPSAVNWVVCGVNAAVYLAELDTRNSSIYPIKVSEASYAVAPILEAVVVKVLAVESVATLTPSTNISKSPLSLTRAT